MLRKFKPLAPLILQQWRILFAIAGLTACTSVISAIQPWPMKLLVDSVLGHGSPPQWLQWLTLRIDPGTKTFALIFCAAGGTIAVFAISAAIDSALTWFWSVLGQRMVHDLSTTLFGRLQRISLTYHQHHSLGDSLSRLSGDAWCIYSLTGRLFSPGEQIFTIFTIGLVAWRLNPQLASISLVASPILAISTIYFGRRLKARAKTSREAESKLASFVHQTLSSMPVVQAFTTEDRNSSHFETLAATAVTVSQRRSIVVSAYGLVSGLITTFGAALVTYFGARQVLDGRLSVGSLIVFIAYIRTLQGAAEGLLKTYGDVKPIEASVDRVLEVLEPRPDEACDVPGARPVERSSAAPRITFENVTFGYETNRPVIEEVSIAIEAGQTIALVGETGAGKSSLLSLIPRFYDPWQGRITLNGEDVREFTLKSLRQQIGFVLQEPFLFPLTVAENIGYGKPGATREEVIHAAQLAQADAFIRDLPDAYDTRLGESGGSLSGGERQRIAIARAILKDAPVLILDEPTSALDARTEAGLMQALGELMKGRTCFVIAHRLSTVRRAGSVVVLSKGRVVEQGTHEELLRRRGAYHRLHWFQHGVIREVVA